MAIDFPRRSSRFHLSSVCWARAAAGSCVCRRRWEQNPKEAISEKFYKCKQAVNPNVGRENIHFHPRGRLQWSFILPSVLCFAGSLRRHIQLFKGSFSRKSKAQAGCKSGVATEALEEETARKRSERPGPTGVLDSGLLVSGSLPAAGPPASGKISVRGRSLHWCVSAVLLGLRFGAGSGRVREWGGT